MAAPGEEERGGTAERPAGFERSSQHVLMLEDRVRTRAFVDAVRETVRPGDVVVDIGTGTGVLAIAAAQAGADHVFAIEATAMADVARRGAAANGFADRITVIRGLSTEVTLPRLADVVVSETIGDDPFDESILPTMRDAGARLARPGARMIPSDLAPVLVPIELDPDIWRRRHYDPGLAADWSRDYGVDFSWLTQEPRAAERFTRARAYVSDRPQIELPAVTFPGTSGSYDASVTWTADRPMVVNALLLGFRCTVGRTELASVTTERLSWEVQAEVLPHPVALAAGDVVDVTVSWTSGLTRIGWVPR